MVRLAPPTRVLWEIYDLEQDPLELDNLAHRPKSRTARQQAELRRLQAKLKRVERTRLRPRSAG